jgi:hypothetical protein
MNPKTPPPDIYERYLRERYIVGREFRYKRDGVRVRVVRVYPSIGRVTRIVFDLSDTDYLTPEEAEGLLTFPNKQLEAMSDADLVFEYMLASRRREEIEDQIMGRFMPRLTELLAAGKVTEAKSLVFDQVPNCVSKVFMMDTLRQHELKSKGIVENPDPHP